MGTVTAAQLLSAWELTTVEPPARRAAAAVAGCRGEPLEEVCGWSVAALDAALFDLRAELFGPNADALTDCPECGECLEFELNLIQLTPALSPHPGDMQRVVGGFTVTARWPSTDDLHFACADRTPTEASVALLERCVVEVLSPGGARLELESVLADVGTDLREWLSGEMEKAEVTIALVCGECGLQFRAPFDIAVFLLSDIDAWADRVLREVHVLASAHGWSEAEILALSPRRRSRYLDLVEADS
jgi:hypothetical protein